MGSKFPFAPLFVVKDSEMQVSHFTSMV